jgi:hypothetical protein
LRDEHHACVGTDEFESYGEVHALGDDTCQRDTGAFLALDDDVEQQFGSVRVDLDVTELIGTQQIEAAVARHHTGQDTFVGGFDKVGRPAARMWCSGLCGLARRPNPS